MQLGDRNIKAAVPGLMDRYPDEILGQVAFVGCRAKLAELSWPAEAAGPQ